MPCRARDEIAQSGGEDIGGEQRHQAVRQRPDLAQAKITAKCDRYVE
jgi:hypothetical protein